MPNLTGSSTAEIHAPLDRVWALVEDVERAPEWQGGLKSMRALDRDDQGRAARCEAETDAKVKTVKSVVRFSYAGPTRLSWTQEKGDLKSVQGSWELEDLGGDRTRATYKLGLEVGIPLPGPVARRAHKSTLKGSVDDLKREAERRAASQRKADGDRPKRSADAGERQAALAEKVAIRPSSSRPAPEPPTEQSPDGDGNRSVTELPGLLVRTARGITEEVAGAGFGVARRAIGIGVRVPGALVNRAGRLVGRGSGTDEYPR
jgi:ribosome-associated toxin RatA of RatAB toxin-antitoxin module